MSKQFVSLLVVLAVLGGGGLGYWFGVRSGAEMSAGAAPSKRVPLFYRNPMNPDITSEVPAKDHMGMDYIPVYADDEQGGPAGTVRIDPVTRQSIGVRSIPAESRSLTRDIHTVGRIDFNEQRITRLHPKIEGWVEELFVDTTGEAVEEDAILLSIYSPQLVSTQQEYLLALNNLDSLAKSPIEDIRRGAEVLVTTALERLRLLDVPEHQIEELKASREVKKQLHIHAPAAGTVISVGAREGQYVSPKTELYFIADLSRVWVFVDVFEDELPWVEVGDSAKIEVEGIPGTIFESELVYIYPYAERATRTVKARLEFDNPNRLLKPDMFADVTIRARPTQEIVAVPSESVVRSGLQEKVFIVKPGGRFEPRDVVVGRNSEGWTEIKQGVGLGEEVVVSAQFLIDSESRLREAAAKMRDLPGDGQAEEMDDDHANH